VRAGGERSQELETGRTLGYLIKRFTSFLRVGVKQMSPSLHRKGGKGGDIEKAQERADLGQQWVPTLSHAKSKKREIDVAFKVGAGDDGQWLIADDGI